MRSGEGMATQMEGTPVGDNAAATGTDVHIHSERPGMSAFAFEDGAFTTPIPHLRAD